VRMAVEGAKVPRCARLVAYSAVPAGRGSLQAIQAHRLRPPSPARVLACSRAVPSPHQGTDARRGKGLIWLTVRGSGVSISARGEDRSA
jgi:hypothetical protein